MANRKHLTSRDIKLIDFLEENNLIITSELAAKYFYRSPTDNHKSALTVAQRRLNICCELGQLKRYRDHIDQCYVYYVGRRPSKIEHRLMITEFLINMHRKYEIVKFKVEFKDLESQYSIRPIDPYKVTDAGGSFPSGENIQSSTFMLLGLNEGKPPLYLRPVTLLSGILAP